MKKKICLLLFTILLFLVPNNVFGAEGTKRFQIDARINPDGSVLVKELITLSGEYNGLLRNIKFKNPKAQTFTGVLADFEGSSIYNATALNNLKVSAIGINDVVYLDDFNATDLFRKVTMATNGQSGVYELTNQPDGIDLKVYNPDYLDEAFYLEYRLENVVVVHNDVAEIAWDFIGDEYNEYIDDVLIVIHLPGEDSNVRVFSHGPINGENRIIDSKTVEATWDFLNANTPIDVRVVFNKNLVPNATKLSNINGLDHILTVEANRAEKANAERTKQRSIIMIVNIICILWFIGLIYFIIRAYHKYDKEYKSTFDQKYYRDFPNTYGPEIMGYLFTRNNIKPEYLSASILELIRKKALKINTESANKKNFSLSVTTEKEPLSSSEIILKDWLINEIGNGELVTDTDIKKAGDKDYKSFLEKYKNWKDDVIGEANKQNFYEDNGFAKAKFCGYVAIEIIIFILNLTLNITAVLPSLMLVPAILAFIYFGSFTKKTVKGNDDYLKWKAFKRFLLDFGRMQEKELPEIYLWEKYLVYATALGIADQVEKTMKIKIKELNYDDNIYNDMTFFHLYRLNMGHMIVHSINDSMSRTISSAAAASTRNSSSGGFGGGASFGGGGFGGGGGGGRF